MDQKQLNALAVVLVDRIYADRFVPAELFAAVEKAVGAEGQGGFLGEWKRRSGMRAAQGKPAIDPGRPLLLSRGFGDAMAEEELANYLPEEKILVNRELFRAVLNSTDFSSLNASQERVLIDRLQRESVGLRNEDVALYYNLIKVNKLASVKRSLNREAPVQTQNPEQAAAELLDLADKAFGFTSSASVGFAKINGGKVFPERNLFIKVVADAVERKKINVLLMRTFLGRKTEKHMASLLDFLKRVAAQRGDDPNELILYTGAYLLMNPCSPDNLGALALSAPLLAYATDKIGKVRTVYYAAMLFMLSFQFILLAQISEVAAKYNDAPEDQRLKLRKLYEADDRRNLLVSNSVNVATRKLAEYKAETREIMNAFKSFLAAHPDLVLPSDLFGIDYRT